MFYGKCFCSKAYLPLRGMITFIVVPQAGFAFKLDLPAVQHYGVLYDRKPKPGSAGGF